MFDRQFDKKAAFDGMKKRGIARVELEFSGGNDEGGIDSTIAYDNNGNTVDLPNATYITQMYIDGKYVRGYYPNGWNNGFVTIDQMPADERDDSEFVENLENIVYGKYYTFAGEFYVSGNAVIDAIRETAQIDGQETVESYESFSETF